MQNHVVHLFILNALVLYENFEGSFTWLTRKNEETVLQCFQKPILSPKMPKLMHKIILFIEPQEDKYFTPSKIGNLFINRFGIDENGSHEVLKICYLENTNWNYYHGYLSKKQGPDRIIN